MKHPGLNKETVKVEEGTQPLGLQMKHWLYLEQQAEHWRLAKCTEEFGTLCSFFPYLQPIDTAGSFDNSCVNAGSPDMPHALQNS